MFVGILAPDDFPLLAVAPWAVHQEVHETISAACRREATRSGLARLIGLLSVAANGNAPQPAPMQLPSPPSLRRTS